eukprot:1422678-Rhodomonas_salina.1
MSGTDLAYGATSQVASPAASPGRRRYQPTLCCYAMCGKVTISPRKTRSASRKVLPPYAVACYALPMRCP